MLITINIIIKFMYCIHQIDNQSNEKIIDLLRENNQDHFVTKIRSFLVDKEFSTLVNITLEKVKNNSSGMYLLVNNNNIQLINKTEKIIQGYVYNSKVSNTEILFTWKLVPFEVSNFNVLAEATKQLVETSVSPELENFIQKEFGSNGLIIGTHRKTSNSKTDLEIKKIDSIDYNTHNWIVGRKSSGKSLLVCDLVDKLIKKNNVIELYIVDPTDELNNLYKTKYPNANIMYTIEQLIMQALDKVFNNTETPKCIVLDNCIKRIHNTSFVNELIRNGRSYNVTLILTTSLLYKEISVASKYNFDNIFLLNEESLFFCKRIYNTCAQIFPNFEVFLTYFKALTENHGAMVIRNNDSLEDKSITDVVYSYLF